MEKGYQEFVQSLRNRISDMTGHAAGVEMGGMENGPAPEDRILVDLSSVPGLKESIGVPVYPLYKEYSDGESFTGISDRIAGFIKDFLNSPAHKECLRMRDYSAARKSLFIRLVNIAKQGIKENAVYRLIDGGDIAEAACLYLGGEGDGSFRSAVVTHGLLKGWGMEGAEDEVMEEAMENSGRLFQPRVFSLEKMFCFGEDYSGEDIEECPESILQAAYGVCLSTDMRTNGASAIVMPGVAEKLSSLLGSGIFAVPTSVHEVMVHRDDEYGVEELRKIMRETINEATSDEEILTKNFIIHYDPAVKAFSCV